MSGKRAAIYVRVSTGKQAEEGISLDTQVEQCTKYILKEGDTVTRIYREEGISGTRLDRPELKRLMDDAKARRYDYAIALTPDRIGRDRGINWYVGVELRKVGVELWYTDDSHKDPIRQAALDMTATIERIMITERTRRGKIGKANRGHVQASRTAPYGHDYDKATKSFKINETEAETYRQIFEWVASGTSINGLARQLRAQGVPTKLGGKWWPGTLRQLIRSRTPLGEWTYNRFECIVPVKPRSAKRRHELSSQRQRDRSEWITVRIDPILEGEEGRQLWERANAVLDANKRHTPRAESHNYLLNGGIMECSHGHNYAGGITGNKAHSNSYRRYFCYGKRSYVTGEAKCTSQTFRAEKLEADIWAEVLENLEKVEQTCAALLKGTTGKTRQTRDQQDMLDIIGHELELNDQEDRLVHLYMEGKISEERFDHSKGRLDKKREVLARRRAEIEERQQAIEQARADMDTARFVAAAFKHGLAVEPTIQQKKAIMNALQVRIRIPDIGPPKVTGLFSDQIVRLAMQYVAAPWEIENADPGAQEQLDYWLSMVAGKYQEAHELLVDRNQTLVI